MKVLPLFLSSLTIGEKVSLSGEMLIRGLGTVFMVLILLWGILSLFNVVFGGQKKEKKASPASQPEVKKAAPAAEEKPAPKAAEPAPAAPAEDNGALIAAITAAIEAYRAEENGGTAYALPFRVVSFKRKTGSAGWQGTSDEN